MISKEDMFGEKLVLGNSPGSCQTQKICGKIIKDDTLCMFLSSCSQTKMEKKKRGKENT